MSNYKNAMRRMRKYVSEVKKNHDRRGPELEKLAQFKGSPYYDQQAAEVDRKIEAEHVRLVESAKKDLIAIVKDMRENVGNRITKAPTPEMSACLSILGQLETLTATEVTLYAQQMADCPLAMRKLQEIAGKHNMRINTPDTDAMMRAVDVLEGNFVTLLGGYRGDIDKSSASVHVLFPYFQGDEDYMNTDAKSTKNADTAFWRDIVQIGTPAMLDSEASMRDTVKAELFFKDLDGLLAYIDKRTVGMDERAVEDERDKILDECPDDYGAKYRLYKSTGIKDPLNVEVNEQ